MLRKLAAFLAAAALLPLSASAQTWSEEEQSAIDHILACWEAGGGQEDWAAFKRVCNPADDTIFWRTTDPAPTEGLDFGGKVNEVWWKEHDVIAFDVRPYRVRLYDDIAAVYFYNVGQYQDSNGNVTEYKGYELRLLRKLDGRWQSLGGMGVPLSQ